MKTEWVVAIVFDLKKKTVTFSIKMATCRGRSLVKMVGLKKEAEPDGTLVLPNRKRGKSKSSTPDQGSPYCAIWTSPNCLHAPVMDTVL